MLYARVRVGLTWEGAAWCCFREAPKKPFYMLLRMYLPDAEVLNGQYEIPGVQRGK